MDTAKIAESLGRLEAIQTAHEREDTRRFDALGVTLAKIDANVQSLLGTQAFTRGVWRAAVTVSAIVSTLVTAAWAWFYRPGP